MSRIAPLLTERLSMRPYRTGDLDALHRLWTDPAVRRYLWDDKVIDRATAEAAMRQGIDCTTARDFGHWAVSERGADALIGFCGLRPLDDGPEIELLYAFHPAYWSRGLATEASTAWLRIGFTTFDLARIWALTDAPNARSEAVMKRLGMRFVERGTYNGLDTVRYMITREEWLDGRR